MGKFVIIAVLLYCIASGQSIGWDQECIKGGVKVMIHYKSSVRLDGKKTNYNIIYKEVSEINKSGKIIKKENYIGYNMNLNYTSKAIYDENTNLIEEEEKIEPSSLGDGHIEKYNYTYFREEGTLLVTKYREGTTPHKTKQFFDINGNITNEIEYYTDDKIIAWRTAEYDEREKIKHEISQCYEYKPMNKYYKYNEKLQIVEIDAQDNGVFRYFYNLSGIPKMIIWNCDGYQTITSYDKFGNTIKELNFNFKKNKWFLVMVDEYEYEY
ncbi:MAG: hypothetical protein A2096_00110 [Spirochaetes bacterium GWF1_41_5]|nr:MAG: hypothetical protein A2096_00110 [Spirochaetes bacterium GWF1_41_5]HBE04176.1 hypothetical protein [Spirochaetia bacterium]